MAEQGDRARLRIAIVGAGRMGERAAGVLHANPAADVSAVIDPDGERAGRIAQSVGARARTSWDGIAELADAVYIASPSALHATQCIEAARLGLDILVDKPLALTADEAASVARAVDEAGVRVMVGFSYRFRAEWRQAYDWVRSGRIGAVTLVNDIVIEAASATPGWYWSVADGGGVIRLQSHHLLDRIAWILGTPVVPRAAVAGPGDAERHASVLATAGSVPVTLSLGFAEGYDDSGVGQFVVQGERGHVVVDSVTRTATLTTVGAPPIVLSAADDDWFASELDAFVADAAEGVPGLEAGMAAAFAADEVLRLLADDRLSPQEHPSPEGITHR